MRIVFFTFFVVAFINSNAQLKLNPYANDGLGSNISSSISVGTSFGSGFSSTFLAPNIYQTVGQKLSLNYGAVFSTGTGNQLIFNEYGYAQVVPANSNTFYVDGNYQVSDRLSIKSTVVVKKGAYSGSQNDMSNFSSNMVRMGMEYKLSENVRLQAEIGMHQGNHPYSPLFSPYNQYPFQRGISPFYSPFIGY